MSTQQQDDRRALASAMIDYLRKYTKLSLIERVTRAEQAVKVLEADEPEPDDKAITTT
jgi:hypothetical protein